GNFSYRTHADFYPSYCGLDINPNKYDGTTREKFRKILLEANSNDQSKILSGTLEKFPLHYFEDLMEEGIITASEYKNKENLHEKISKCITELRGEVIEQGELKHNIAFVREALNQAETLIKNHSYSSAVDRAHTAIHGYLKELCVQQGIIFERTDVNIQEMWSKLKTDHPSFNIDVKKHHKPVNQTVNVVSKFLNSMNDIRNKHGYSHPNEDIIEEKEAMFIINLSRVLLHYLDSKTNE
uniref:abortive infection family protein n=1 Tax=Alkalibacillus haloalkaliphilus TaxID=94136 RepID=UPI000374FE3E